MPCCSSRCATRGPRPAPPPQHLGSARGGPGRWRRRGWGGLLGRLALSGRRRWGALCRAPGSGAAGGRAGEPERGNVSGPCCPPLRGALLSPRALRRGPGWGKAGAGGARGPFQAPGAVLGRRHPLLREWRLRHEWRAAPGAVVAVTDTFGVSAERGRFSQLLASSRTPSFGGRRFSATITATSKARDSFGQSGCGPSTRCSGGVRC